MGLVHLGIPMNLAEWIRKQTGVRVFVETGTFMGDTAAWAGDCFAQVMTVERDPQLYQGATARFASDGHIQCLQGHSIQVLNTILCQLQEPALFWLDAHWSGDGTYGEGDECPLTAELALILASPHDHIVLIDDARLFLAPPPPPHEPGQWPDLQSLMAVLAGSRERPRFTIIQDDCILNFPLAMRVAFVTYAQQRAGNAFDAWLKGDKWRRSGMWKKMLLLLKHRFKGGPSPDQTAWTT